MDPIGIAGTVIALLVLLVAMRTVRIVPQAKARNVERLGRYRKTLEPGMNFVIPLIDRVKPLIDLREQVVSFLGQPVITEDNLVVKIDTVLFFQVTDPRAADYEIVNYIQAIEQLTATMLRSVIGSMDLERSLTSRDQINTMLRGVLDDASGKWGIRVTRVEIKAIDPPQTVKEAMEKQMRAEREKRAAVLTAEGARQAQILTADGDKQSAILRAEGDKQSAILKAEGQAQAIGTVFQSIHENDPDPKLLAYQYLQTLPQLAQGQGSTMWMIPSELTGALKSLSSAFGADGELGREGGGPGIATHDGAAPAEISRAGTARAGTARAGTARAGTARAGTGRAGGDRGDASRAGASLDEVGLDEVGRGDAGRAGLEEAGNAARSGRGQVPRARDGAAGELGAAPAGGVTESPGDTAPTTGVTAPTTSATEPTTGATDSADDVAEPVRDVAEPVRDVLEHAESVPDVLSADGDPDEPPSASGG